MSEKGREPASRSDLGRRARDGRGSNRGGRRRRSRGEHGDARVRSALRALLIVSSRTTGSDTSTPDAHQWHESMQMPSRGCPSRASQSAASSSTRATDRPARAGGVLHAQPEVVRRQIERALGARVRRPRAPRRIRSRGVTPRGRQPPGLRSRQPSPSSRGATTSDFARISSSRLARFTRYRAWQRTAATPASSRRRRNRSTSSGAWAVGRHMRGLWVKTCTASPPTTSTRSMELEIPPAAET